MIQHLLFVTSKLLNISDITKKIGSFFKLPIQLFYGVPYPELAFADWAWFARAPRSLFIDGTYGRVSYLISLYKRDACPDIGACVSLV
jgi:hypothetical protein